MRTATRAFVGVLLAVLAWSFPASAAGYDTPILYTARHMGMGGTAIASVRDGSAAFHNPAGFANMGAGNVIIDVSMLTGHLVANPAPLSLVPDVHADQVKSNATIAPFFLVGGGVRITDWLVTGLAFYPVASAGGSYEYNIVEPKMKFQDGNPVPNINQRPTVYDETKIVFFELAPSIALDLPGNLRLGFSYRLSMISMDRFQGTPDDPARTINMELSGLNLAGYKAGLQWSPVEGLDVGLVYRSETETVITGEDGSMALVPFEVANTTFTLPDKIGAGIRGTVAPVSLALDAEYTFNSKVQDQIFTFFGDSEPGAKAVRLANFARWQDSVTVRAGVEYCLTLEPLGVDHRLKPRLGYVYDGQVGNKAFPTAFGTPPAATQTFTTGIGYDGGDWEINLAYAYRYGSVTIDNTEAAYAGESNVDDCKFCSKPGLYEIALHGIYTDFSWDF